MEELYEEIKKYLWNNGNDKEAFEMMAKLAVNGKLQRSHFTLLEIIGRGHFGEVWLKPHIADLVYKTHAYKFFLFLFMTFYLITFDVGHIRAYIVVHTPYSISTSNVFRYRQ